MKKYSIICLLLFCVLHMNAQYNEVEISHIISSDKIDNGEPCNARNLFPYYMDNRDSCILCVHNVYLNTYKYYKYCSKDNSIVMVDAVNTPYIDGNTDSLHSLLVNYYIRQRNSIDIYKSDNNALISTIQMSIDLLKQEIPFSVNTNNIVAYKNKQNNCITIYDGIDNLHLENSEYVENFTWITDTSLLYAVPHLEDYQGTFSYTLHVYDVQNHTYLPVVSDKLYDYFDCYNNDIFFLNADLQLCKANLKKNENDYSMASIKILTTEKLYNLQADRLFKLPDENHFLMISYTDYDLLQLK